MSENEPVNYRIGLFAAILISILAIFLDITELALDLAGTFLGGFGVVIGYFKDFSTIILMPGIFFILGAPFWRGRKAKKKMITMVTAGVISFIPWLGAFMPETFIATVVTIYLTRKEDKEGYQKKSLASNISRARRMRQRVRRISREE